MNNFFQRIILMLITVISTSCELKFREDNDYFTPAYRTKEIESGKIEVSLHKRYFVRNYRYNIMKFDSIALNIICQAINDSIPITKLYFTFIDGPDELLYENLASYIWSVDTPDKIRMLRGEEPNYRDIIIPFDCKLNEKYKKKE